MTSASELRSFCHFSSPSSSSSEAAWPSTERNSCPSTAGEAGAQAPGTKGGKPGSPPQGQVWVGCTEGTGSGTIHPFSREPHSHPLHVPTSEATEACGAHPQGLAQAPSWPAGAPPWGFTQGPGGQEAVSLLCFLR